MNLLPALTIGLSFGLLAGLLVYYIMDYFEAEEKERKGSHEHELTVASSNCVEVVFNGQAKTIELPPLEKRTIVSEQIQWVEKGGEGG